MEEDELRKLFGMRDRILTGTGESEERVTGVMIKYFYRANERLKKMGWEEMRNHETAIRSQLETKAPLMVKHTPKMFLKRVVDLSIPPAKADQLNERKEGVH